MEPKLKKIDCPDKGDMITLATKQQVYSLVLGTDLVLDEGVSVEVVARVRELMPGTASIDWVALSVCDHDEKYVRVPSQQYEEMKNEAEVFNSWSKVLDVIA